MSSNTKAADDYAAIAAALKKIEDGKAEALNHSSLPEEPEKPAPDYMYAPMGDYTCWADGLAPSAINDAARRAWFGLGNFNIPDLRGKVTEQAASTNRWEWVEEKQGWVLLDC